MQIVGPGTEGAPQKGGKKPEKKEDDKENGEDKSEKGGAEDVEDKDKKSKSGDNDGKKKTKNKEKKNEDGTDTEGDSEDDKKPKKPTGPKKPSSKKEAAKTGDLESKLKLLKEIKELNPSSIIEELQNTPADKLKEIQPLLEEVTESLQGTPLGDYFESLTSVVEMDGLKSVTKFFPALVSTAFNLVATLGSLLMIAIGSIGSTLVSLLKTLFNGVTSLFR